VSVSDYHERKCATSELTNAVFSISLSHHHGVQNREAETKLLPFFFNPEAMYTGSSCFEIMFLYAVKQQGNHANIFSACA
jgi:hypothetical protein